ncbi:hypothetical protein J7J18_02575 [bacterium]|nr:hypothetical protein [bacterium]
MKTYDDETPPSNHDMLIELRTDMKWVKDQIKDMKEDMEDLKQFRWKFYGAVAAISAIVSFTVSIIIAIFT